MMNNMMKRTLLIASCAMIFFAMSGLMPASADITNGLVGWWKLDDGSGTNAYDSTGNGKDGVLAGMTEGNWVTNGRIGGALNFNATNARVELPALNLNTNTITITAWVKGFAQSWYAGVVFSRAGNTVAGLNVHGSERDVRHHWNEGPYNWSSGLLVPSNEWAHIAMSVTPAAASLYLNAAGATNTSSYANEEFNGVTCIGLDPYDTTTRRWVGMIDDVRIYNRALSASDITELYNYSGVSAPTVNNNGGASNLTATTSVLNGNLISTGGAETIAYFFYGTNDGGAAWGSWQYTNNMGTKGAGLVTNYVTGLSPGALYSYRFYATNSAGQSWASAASNFTTLQLNGPVFKIW